MKGGYIYFNDNGKCWSYYAVWIADLRDIRQKMLVHTLEKMLVHTLKKMPVHTLEKMLPHTLKKILMP